MNQLEQAQILRDAAQYIRENGWTRGTAGWYGEPGHPACLEGAIAIAIGQKLVPGKLLYGGRFGEIVHLLHERVNRIPFMWNDHPGRTEGDVLALLEDTAFDLELAAQIKAESPVPPPAPEPEPEPAPEPTPMEVRA